MDLEEIKLYLRIDHNEEDTLLLSLQKASENYLYNAGCAKNYDNNLYKIAVKMLITHWYDNRGLIGSTNLINYSLESIIYQLRDTNIEGDINGNK